jgi:hypothetical protein
MVQENNNKQYIVIRAMLRIENIMIKFSAYSDDDTAGEVQPDIGGKR